MPCGHACATRYQAGEGGVGNRFVLEMKEKEVEASPEVRGIERPSNSEKTVNVRRKTRKIRTVEKLSGKEARGNPRTPITKGDPGMPDRPTSMTSGFMGRRRQRLAT